MPIDMSLEDAEDKLQAPANAAAADYDDNDDDDDECDGAVPVKRQRTDATPPECYTSVETDAINKVTRLLCLPFHFDS